MGSTQYDPRRYDALIDEIDNLSSEGLDEAETNAIEALRAGETRGIPKDRDDPAPPRSTISGSSMTTEGL